MLKIAVLDDSKASLGMEVELIANSFRSYDIQTQIDSFTQPNSLYQEMIEQNYDLYFLDISVGEFSGIDAAKKIREKSVSSTIIFVSSHEEDVFECFTVFPLGFVRKSKLFEDMAKLIDTYVTTKYDSGNKAHSDSIQIRIKNEYVSVSVPSIVFVEGNRNYQSFHVEEKGSEIIYDARVSLNEIEEKLQSYGFLRCHKGFLVNYKFIKRIGHDTIILLNGTEVPVSKNRRDDTLEKFMDLSRNMHVFD